MDFKYGDLPEKIPTVVWVYWDFQGEYMDTSDDPKDGDQWARYANRGHGYAAKYTLIEKMGE